MVRKFWLYFIEMTAKDVRSLVVTSLFIVGSAAGVWKRQAILDWWRLRGYDPPTRIIELADNTTMNSSSRRLFYVYHPVLEGKETFSGHCNIAEETIVMGCYVSNRGIYLFDVQDPRLAGIHEVTAAHELLHAAYDRLSKTERERIDKQLTDFFQTVTDERLIDTVESYRKRDPSIVPNELHSILGTEVRELPADLEAHYKRYFDDRRKIVGYSESYEQVFTEIKNQLKAYQAEMDELKPKIDANRTRLNNMNEEIRSDRTRLDAMMASGDTAGYNAAVPGFNAKVRAYNNLVIATKALIDRYNKIVQDYNQLAARQHELIKSLDSSLTGAHSQ